MLCNCCGISQSRQCGSAALGAEDEQHPPLGEGSNVEPDSVQLESIVLTFPTAEDVQLATQLQKNATKYTISFVLHGNGLF